MSQKILLVDDEEDILEFLSYNLIKDGFEILTANNGAKGLALAKKHKPDLVILDVMMPEMDGVDVCQRIRELPELDESLVLFLSARAEDYSELAGFSAGADDYITKPIKPKLLISRVKAILRRKSRNKAVNNIKVGGIEIDQEKHTISCNGEFISLARKEFKLLFYLMTIPAKVFTRQEIINEVWKDAIVGDRTIDVHIRKIREKIGDNHIKTVKGVGYKFDI
ncbi:response regulator transcription factor [Flavobacteriales bacterium]|nr:response regulator transcription factor [Flavobacteriales bacterium]